MTSPRNLNILIDLHCSVTMNNDASVMLLSLITSVSAGAAATRWPHKAVKNRQTLLLGIKWIRKSVE